MVKKEVKYEGLYDYFFDLLDSNVYDQQRGRQVVDFAKSHLDKIAPIKKQSWKNVVEIRLEEKILKFYSDQDNFTILEHPEQIIGFKINSKQNLNEVVLIKNNLHC